MILDKIVPPRLPRLKFLDGLRGWAAIVVLLFHVFCDALPFDVTLGSKLRLFLPFNGAMAIFTFFVVSGFSLSADYLNRGDLNSWMRITIGRYFRLAIPIFAACLIVHVWMLTGLLAAPDDRLVTFQQFLTFVPTVGHLLSFSFYGVFFDYRDTYIGPLWTMRYELIGSFIALAAVLIARPRPFRLLLFLFIAVVLLVFAPDPFYPVLALFPIGCALADGYVRGWMKSIPQRVGLGLLILAVLVPILCPYSLTVWACIGTTALIVGSVATPPVRRFLESDFSVRLGDVCFPLYLIHGPVICMLGEPLMRTFGQNMTWRVLIDVFTIIASLAAAFAFTPANALAIWASRRIGYTVTNLVQASQAIRRSKEPA